MIPSLRAILVLLSLAAPLSAQRPAQISGRVTDPSGAPISGAQVWITALNVGTLTDSLGAYHLVIPAARLRSAAPPLTLTVLRIGFTAPPRAVRVRPGRSIRQDITASPSVLSLEGLVVTAQAVSRHRETMGLDVASVTATNAPAGRGGPGSRFNTEEYRHIEDNRFQSVAANPRSTFAIDVDRASYANVRRFLREGMLPPADAVRIEEMVNYFSYDYAGPTDDQPFAVHTEVGSAPWSPRHRLVRVALQARRPAGEMPASNLVFLIDVSGSMETEKKLPLVKRSMRLLVDQLRPQDRVAIVVYAGAVGLVLDATPGDQRERILRAIDGLEAGGSTAGAQGIRLAYGIARRGRVPGGNNRVILATDGDFNVGVSSEGELVRLIEQERESGISLTVLGVGEGNLADARMEALADHGNGNYAYLDGLEEARKVLVDEVRGTLFTVAKDVKVQVEFNPARVAGYRLVGYENRMLQDEDFNDDRRDAGEMGAGHSVTALYEIVPAGEPIPRVRGDALRYQRTPRLGAGGSDEMMFVRVRYKRPEGGGSHLLEHVVRDEPPADHSDGYRWAAAVAEFGMLLRASEYRGSASVAEVLEEARGAVGADPGGWRAEFVRLVESYRGLAASGQVREGDGR